METASADITSPLPHNLPAGLAVPVVFASILATN